tara:strand:+ start:4729 stop:5982 length:1254 start_codon:yes stop_codon:yes gene_type:complete
MTTVITNENIHELVYNYIYEKESLPDFLKGKPINEWDVSRVTDMDDLFKNSYSSFNEDIGNWDVSNVTTMDSMFKNAFAFNKFIGEWNTKNVNTMQSMFEKSGFNQPIENWDISSLEDMSEMFKNTTEFNQPLNKWNVRNVYYINNIFEGSHKFNQPLGNWDLRELTEPRLYKDMFKNARSFNNVKPIYPGQNTRSVSRSNLVNENEFEEMKIIQTSVISPLPTTAYDIYELEDVNVHDFLNKYKGEDKYKNKYNKIFNYGDKLYAVDINNIDLSVTNTYFECFEVNTMNPSNIELRNPLFQINKLVVGDGFVYYKQLEDAIKSDHQIFEIYQDSPLKEIKSSISYQMLTPQANAVSANHCQDGGNSEIYKILKVFSNVGGRRKKTYKNKKIKIKTQKHKIKKIKSTKKITNKIRKK